MRILLCFLLLLICGAAQAAEPASRTVVYLLDPRNATFTENTMPTLYKNEQTDVVATRTLTGSEAATLARLLKAELIETDPPFCGHRPGYAIRTYRGDEIQMTVTICGLCRTWSRDGQPHGLKGKRTLSFLTRLLPLPDVWADAKTGFDIGMAEDGPFYSLKKQDDG